MLEQLKELFGSFLPLLEHIPAIRAVLGFILVFFLPGFTWTLVFFRKINIIERVALSFGLSIAAVILSLFLLNRLIGMKITGFNSLLVILVLTIIPVVIYYINRLIRRRREGADSS